MKINPKNQLFLCNSEIIIGIFLAFFANLIIMHPTPSWQISEFSTAPLCLHVMLFYAIIPILIQGASNFGVDCIQCSSCA